jgi:hypothetical protein
VALVVARRHDSVDGHAVDLAEYERLRGEIDNRTQIANGLFALELTALAAGLASFDAFPDVAIGIAVASTCLWMLWTDQEVQVWKIAAYLEIELAPRLREVNPGALGWERFLRRLDKGGDDARQALRLSRPTRMVSSFPHTRKVGFYASLLFGGAPLILLLISTSTLFEDMSGTARTTRVLILLGSLIAWIAAVYVYRQSRIFESIIDSAIAASAFLPSAGDRGRAGGASSEPPGSRSEHSDTARDRDA